MSLSRASVGRILAAVGLVTFASGCADKGGGTTNPSTPTTIALSSGDFTLDGLGSIKTLTATVKDQNGAAMSGQTVTWSSDAGTVATVGTDGAVTAVAVGTAHVTATSGSLTQSVAVTVTQNPTTLAKSAGDAQTGAVATALTNPLVVLVSDVNNHPIAGAAVAFAVTAGGGSVGTPAATTGVDGTASTTWTLGTVAGSAQTATATVTGIAAAGFTATATAGPATIIAAVSGNNQTGATSAALANAVVVKVTDANNNPVAGVTVTFAVTGGGGSVLPTSQATGSNGQAQTTWTLGAAAGANTMTASANGAGGAPLTGSALGFSATGSTIALTSITEDTLVEGASIHLNGTGFSTTLGNNSVSIDGAAAAVTAATTTQLTVTVPNYDCKPARDGGTTVTVSSVTTAAVVKRIHPAAFITATTVGSQQILQSPAGFCLQFRPSTTGGDGYMIGVGAAAELNSSTFDITISTGTGAASAPPIFGAPAARAVTTFLPQGSAAVDPELRRMWQGQRAMEDRRNQWMRDSLPLLLARGAALQTRAAAARAAFRSPSVALAVPNVGDVISIKVPTGANVCASSVTVSAKVKAVGTSGIWATDVANPLGDTLLDATVQAYSDTFDTKIYAGDTMYFGAPSDIDGNSRVIVLLTWQVNKLPNNTAGFVSPGDLLSPGSCAPSNSGEYFYGQVPDPNNLSGTGARTKASVLNQMPSLIAHEFTHNIQVSRRLIIAGSNTTMNSWEAEGQAMLGQEVVGHLFYGNSPGQNYGGTTLVNGQRFYLQAFEQLAEYFGGDFTNMAVKIQNAPEQCTLFGSGLAGGQGPCAGDAFYGASWSFQRYISDRFGATYPAGGLASGEIKLNHDIIFKFPTQAGRTNWESVLGVGFDSLFAQWGGMLADDDQVAGLSAVQQLKSWSIPSTSATLVANFGTAFQLAPTSRTFSVFTDNHTIRGGGTTFTKLTSAGAHPALAVKVRDKNTGNAISATPKMQLWVTRIQ